MSVITRLSLVAVIATIVCANVSADDNIANQARFQAFKAENPQARFHGQQFFDNEGFFEQDRTASMIYGTVLATGPTAQESAWNFYDKIDGIYVDKIGELQPQHWPSGNVLQGVMWNRATQRHGFYTFRYQQTLNDIPVFRSGIGFLVRNEPDFPVVMASNNFKELIDIDIANLANAKPVITDIMKTNAAAEMTVPNIKIDGTQSLLANERQRQIPVETADAEVVIWAGNTSTPVEAEVAVQFYATQGTPMNFSSYRRYLIVAAVDDGEILLAESQVHSYDVSGTVSGDGTDGDASLECDPLATFALPYAEVSITGGETAFADVNGVFNIPSNAGGTVEVNSRLEGMYFSLFDQSLGGDTPVISINVAEPGSVDFIHNAGGTGEFPTANVNAYLHSNIVRDFVLDIEPTFPTIDTQLDFAINTNIDDDCNAFYNGVSINFFRNAGGCNSTAFADVVYHEYGHHLVNVTGNGQGQFGEGSSDTMGVLIEDNPELAVGFFGNCNGFLRSAENFREYPCDGQIHDCGQLISGCVWDTVNEIRATDPDNALAITSQLFVSMLPVRGAMGGSTYIGPEIPIIFLQLDDDDADISNGSPHYEQIATAFNAHNMQVPDLVWLNLSYPNGTPDNVSPFGGTSFQVDVESNVSTAVADSGVLHVDTGSGFVEYPMTVIDADSYLATFPEVECGSFVRYFVSVDANNGEVQTGPPSAPERTTFSSLSTSGLTTVFLDDFETDLNWTVSGTASTGLWERGVPVGGGTRNDPPTDADGSGQCYLTENEAGNTDVDNGTSILTSPILDATVGPDEFALLSYYRWYSNGDSDDPFTVEISNDGGTNWTIVEVVGPVGIETFGGWIYKQFDVADFVAPTDNMRVRFTALDEGGGDVVEAAVDGVSIEAASCDEMVLHGDVNLDGVVNLLDVAPFVAILQNSGFQAEADVNKDGVVNLLDVQPFVELLTP